MCVCVRPCTCVCGRLHSVCNSPELHNGSNNVLIDVTLTIKIPAMKEMGGRSQKCVHSLLSER